MQINIDDTHEEPPKRGSSFGERLAENEYFTGAGHLNILVNMRRDITARVPLLILTGEEGCGKSVLGRMVAAESRPGCIVVYFNRTVDSFEDLVSLVAERLDVDVPEQTRDGITAAVEQIAVAVSIRNERLLLILDGAERIYLATQERLRKMMDRLNRVVVSMQLVLIGRPLLLDNLRQLSICNFEEIQEKRYVLEPLTLAETRSYLEFCKKKMPDTESGIFTQETVDRIYQGSLGNFKQIHNLAEQLCNRYNKDASFWVLLENVAGGPEKKTLRRSSRRHPLPPLEKFDPRKLTRRQQLIGGGCAAALLVLFLLLNPGGEEKGPADVVPGSSETVAEVVQVQETTESEVVAKPEEPRLETPVQPTESEQAVEEGLDTQEKVAPEQEVEQVGESIVTSLDSGPVAAEPAVPEDAADVEEQEPVVSPAQKELQQADDLVAEAQQAVELARGAKGPEIAVAPKAKEQPATVAPVAVPDVPVLTAVPEKTEIVVLPVKVMEKAADASEKVIASAPVLRPDRAKKYAAVAEIAAPKSAVRLETGVLQSVETRAAKKQIPLLSVEKVKLKKTAAAGTTGEGAVKVIATRVEPARDTVTVAESGQVRQSTAPHVEAETKKIPVLNKAIVPEKD